MTVLLGRGRCKFRLCPRWVEALLVVLLLCSLVPLPSPMPDPSDDPVRNILPSSLANSCLQQFHNLFILLPMFLKLFFFLLDSLLHLTMSIKRLVFVESTQALCFLSSCRGYGHALSDVSLDSSLGSRSFNAFDEIEGCNRM